jgi:hypothetical protein
MALGSGCVEVTGQAAVGCANLADIWIRATLELDNLLNNKRLSCIM